MDQRHSWRTGDELLLLESKGGRRFSVIGKVTRRCHPDTFGAIRAIARAAARTMSEPEAEDIGCEAKSGNVRT
jgi:hypothetical protein